VSDLKRWAKHMGFKLWHYLGRLGGVLFIPLIVLGLFAQEDTGLGTAGRAAYLALAVLGVTGATLAILLLFTRFRFSCPSCHGRSTQFGIKKEAGMWLYCEDCDLLMREDGFLKLKLICEKAPNNRQSQCR